MAPPSSDLPPQLLDLTDDERSKVLALDHRVLRRLYDVLALPSDIRGRLHTPALRRQAAVLVQETMYRARGDSDIVLGRGRLSVEPSVWTDGPDVSRHRLHHHRVGSPVP